MSRTIRPVLTEFGLGRAGWSKLHELAGQRRRHPRDQALQLLRYALFHAINGRDVELKDHQLQFLLGAEEQVA